MAQDIPADILGHIDNEVVPTIPGVAGKCNDFIENFPEPGHGEKKFKNPGDIEGNHPQQGV